MEKPLDNKIFLIFGIGFVIVATIFCIVTFNNVDADIERATTFCNSIGMDYDSIESPRVCYTDENDTRYIIKIIESDGKYRLLKSGERLV